MNTFRVTVDELAAEYNNQVQLIRDTHEQLKALEATAQSKDGMISVTVGAQGHVRAIRFNPRVYNKLSPSELATALTQQIHRATAEVSERRQELIRPLMPADLPYEEFFGEDGGLEMFLPQPVELTE